MVYKVILLKHDRKLCVRISKRRFEQLYFLECSHLHAMRGLEIQIILNLIQKQKIEISTTLLHFSEIMITLSLLLYF